MVLHLMVSGCDLHRPAAGRQLRFSVDAEGDGWIRGLGSSSLPLPRFLPQIQPKR